ncbi:MAG: AAA-associated domain-containing protein [Thermoplasmatota archaeon]
MTTALPEATVGQIVGVLEIAKDHNGKVDAARISQEYDLEIDELLPAIQGAELMGLVRVSEGDVILTDVGTRLLKASLSARKTIIREQLKATPIFQDVIKKLKQTGGSISKEDLAQILGFKLWTHDTETAVRTLIAWGRHARILAYDADTGQITLRPEATAEPKPPAERAKRGEGGEGGAPASKAAPASVPSGPSEEGGRDGAPTREGAGSPKGDGSNMAPQVASTLQRRLRRHGAG